MPDDVLRMRATVVSDQALANLRAIGREIGAIPKTAGQGVAQVNTQFQTLGQTVKNLRRELSQAIPALGGFGLGAAGVGLAAGAMLRTLTDMSKKLIEVKYVSKELGLSEQAVKGFGSAAEEAGVSAEEFLASLSGFKRVTEDLGLNMGTIRGDLTAMFGSRLTNDLRAANGNFEEQLRLVWEMKEALEKTGQQAALKKLYDMLQLSERSLRLEWEKMQAAKARQPLTSKEDMEKLERYTHEVKLLGEAWNKFMMTTGVTLFPGLTNAIGLATDLVALLERAAALMPGQTKAPGLETIPGMIREMGPGGMLGPSMPLGPGHIWPLPPADPKLGAWENMKKALQAGPLARWLGWGDKTPGAQQFGNPLAHMSAVTGMVNAGRFSEAVQGWPESTNIEDRREQAGVPWYTQTKQVIKDTVTEVGRDLGFERFRAPIVPPGSAAGSPLSAAAGVHDIGSSGTPLGLIGMRGLEGTPAQGALEDFTNAVKRGTFEGLQEFDSIEGGFGGGGGGAAGFGIGHGRIGGRPGLGGGPGGAVAGPGAGGPGGAPAGPPGPGGVPTGPGGITPGTPGSTGPASAGGRAGITAPAGTGIANQGLATVTTPGGKTFKVDARYAENFKGFLADYEKAGGVLGPDTGTLGTRNNPSGHPIGTAIDINQIGYGIRSSKGTSLDPAVEDELARKWGFVSGHQWRKPDTGHFGIQSPEAARKALEQQGIKGGPPPSGATAPAGVPNYQGGTKATWFDTGGKIPGWPDPSGQREGAQASGLPSTTPGISTPGRTGLGEWFQVTLPDGRTVVTQKTDVGPGKGPQAKGIGLDVNAALASQLYPGGPSTFPSGKGGFQVKPLGKNLPPGMVPGLQQRGRTAGQPSGAVAPTSGLMSATQQQIGEGQVQAETQQKSGAELLADRLDAENRLDKATSPTRVNGHVNVTVNSNGTKASTAVKHGGRLFQRSTIKQHRQMQRTNDTTGDTGGGDTGGGGDVGGASAGAD